VSFHGEFVCVDCWGHGTYGVFLLFYLHLITCTSPPSFFRLLSSLSLLSFLLLLLLSLSLSLSRIFATLLPPSPTYIFQQLGVTLFSKRNGRDFPPQNDVCFCRKRRRSGKNTMSGSTPKKREGNNDEEINIIIDEMNCAVPFGNIMTELKPLC